MLVKMLDLIGYSGVAIVLLGVVSIYLCLVNVIYTTI